MARRLSRRTFVAAATAWPAAALLPSGLQAEAAWKPGAGTRMVVPAAPGGTTDIVARLLAAFLQQSWGQSCVVDNKSGAGGVIGSTEVAKATPDGQTLLMGNIGPQSIAYSLYRNMPYTPKSLIPVSNVITAPNVLVVHPSVPANTVPEFVAWLKAQDGKASYASSGTGQSPHLSGAWFLQLTGTKAEHIPYRGAGAGAAGPDGGCHPVLLRQPHHRHRVRARGQAARARHHLGPAQPADARAGADLRDHARAEAVRRLDMVRHLPAGRHAQARGRFAQRPDEGLARRRQDPERFKAMAGFPAYGTPEQFEGFVNAQIALWKSVIDKEGLKLDVN